MTDEESREVDALKHQLEQLKEKNRRLEKKALEDSWRTSPDTSGGAFTQDEINRAKDWR